jgi:hypothetical protein
MRPTLIKYGKLVNLGNYQNEHFDVEVIVEEGDHVQEAIKTARGIVEIAIEVRKKEEEDAAHGRELEWARRVVAEGREAWGEWDFQKAHKLLGSTAPDLPKVDAMAAIDDMPF